jgi:hypothetical protein
MLSSTTRNEDGNSDPNYVASRPIDPAMTLFPFMILLSPSLLRIQSCWPVIEGSHFGAVYGPIHKIIT